MAALISTHKFTVLDEAILATIVYSDTFDYLLTVDEIVRWLPVHSCPSQVEVRLRWPLAVLVDWQEGLVCLRGREQLRCLRLERERATSDLLPKARRYGRIIGRLPFVRMVAITGSIAAGNAERGADIDYLIVTAPGRVWTVRTMTMAVVRAARYLHRVTLCPNYILDEQSLALPERDQYTARELLQMVPVSGYRVYRRMLAANDWCATLLPNAGAQPVRPERRSSHIRRGVESVLQTAPFDRLEAAILLRKTDELARQSPSSEARFDAQMCKGHGNAWGERTRKSVAARMQALLEAAG